MPLFNDRNSAITFNCLGLSLIIIMVNLCCMRQNNIFEKRQIKVNSIIDFHSQHLSL